MCCSTSEPSQSSSRRISSLKDSSTLLNIWESLKDETCLLLLWDYSPVTLHTLVFIHITSVVQPMYIFKARNKVSKSCLKVELFFHRFKYFVVFRYICLVFTTNRVLRTRRTSLLWYSSLRCSVALISKAHLLLFWDGSLVVLRTFLFIHKSSVVKSLRISMAMNRGI